ncbi:hypothetical protein V8C86DRAFT_2801787 [Haematococcus lacustris]
MPSTHLPALLHVLKGLIASAGSAMGIDTHECSSSSSSSAGEKRQRASSGSPSCKGVGVGDYDCVCCSEFLLEPVVAPCGHDMCKVCYDQWCRMSPGLLVCPLCRAPMPRNLGVCIRLNKTLKALHPTEVMRRQIEQLCRSDPVPDMSCQASLEDGEVQQLLQQPAPQAASPGSWHWASQASAMYYHLAMQTWQVHPTFWAHATQQSMQRCGGQLAPLAVPGGNASPASFASGSWTTAPANSANLTAMGLPVIDVLCHQRSLQQQRQQQQSGSLALSPVLGAVVALQQLNPHQPALSTQQGHTPPAVTAAAASPTASHATPTYSPALAAPAASGRPAATPTPLSIASPPTAPWQSLADVPERLNLARAIVQLVQAQGLQQVLGPATLAAAQAIEVSLYRTAPSRDNYLDRSSLAVRVLQVVRQRVAAARARRAALARQQAGSDPNPGLTAAKVTVR